MFKVSKSVLLSYVNQMFSFRPFNETLQSLRSTGALDFYTPRPKKERGTCIKGLFWPPLEPKTESCFSPISSCFFIRRIAQV